MEKQIFRFLYLVLGIFASTYSQLSWEGCPDISLSDFELVTLVGPDDTQEPLKMDFDMDEEGNVDVYFVEKDGAVKMYDAPTGTLHLLGNFDPSTFSEDGLTGIALDPDFKTNGWIFFYYSKFTSTPDTEFRISRVTLNDETKQLDMSSEVILLAIPCGRNRWHTAGAMRFDAYGDLWINVGDNEAEQRGPANTADLRGGILRITPQDDGTYTIPDGNLWEHAAAHFEELGEADVAEQYRDSTRAKREIYYMGTRNAYTLALDPVRRWAAIGDCGPDFVPPRQNPPVPADSMTEEHTVVTEPGFGGWPYFAGSLWRQPELAKGYDEPDEVFWGDAMDYDKPVNTNETIEGIPQLLPMKRPTYPYPHSCAMTGPIYRYDGDLQSSIKMPPHFNRVWLVADYQRSWVRAAYLAEDGSEIVGEPIELFRGLGLPRMVDFQQGPDGALYLMGYSRGPGPGVHRIEYNGSCHPNEPKLETITSVQRQLWKKEVKLKKHILQVPNVAHTLMIRDIKGKTIKALSGETSWQYDLRREIGVEQSGIYIVTVQTKVGQVSFRYLGM